jgi:hypothetical protein
MDAEPPSSAALVPGTLLFCEGFFSVLSVAKERLNTKVTETLRVLCVEAFEATEDTEKFVLVAANGRAGQHRFTHSLLSSSA